MRLLKYHILLIIPAVLLLASCSAPKKVPYLIKADEIPVEVLSESQTLKDPVINIGDVLNIQVTGLNMAAVAPFNKGSYVSADGTITGMNGNSTNTTTMTSTSGGDFSTAFYLVNTDGCIEFPILGSLHVAGKTKKEIATLIAGEIYPKYITEKPTVDIRLMNFRIVVIGAVNSPGVKRSLSERMTILEAIALSGDLNIRGSRDNIMLYRVNADGTREIHRLNLNDPNLLLSPYFYLQQNDVIYVEPNQSMKNTSWALNPAVTVTISLLGSTMSLASFIIGIVNLSK